MLHLPPLPTAPTRLPPARPEAQQVLAALPTTAPSAEALCAATGLTPPGLRAELRRLWWSGHLDAPPPPPALGAGGGPWTNTLSLPLHFAPGLRHACQGCGGCCSASDIGPILAPQAQTLLAHRWPGIDAPLQAVSYQGHTVYLTAKEQDTCVFLDEDRLCRVHARLGAAAKPLPCRQFPWRFVRAGQRIDVSLYAECRAWEAATAPEVAPAPEALSAELRTILSQRSIPALPPQIPVDGRAVLPLEDYLAAEEALIAAIRAAEGPWWAPLDAFRAGLPALLRTPEPAWLARTDWEAAFPDADWTAAAARRPLLEAVRGFAQHAQGVAAERALPWLSQRFAFLERACGACELVQPQALRVRAAEADGLRRMLADLLVSALFGKELVLADEAGGLRVGAARLWLRTWLTIHAAAARAREACRVQVLPQDLNDSMVTLSKVLREPAVEGLLAQLAPLLLDAFAEGAALGD